MAIFQEAAAANLLRRARIDEAPIEMMKCGGEISVHRLGNNRRPLLRLVCGVFGRRRWRRRQNIVELRALEQRIKSNLKRVDAEFKLAAHCVDEFELDTSAKILLFGCCKVFFVF